MNKPTNQSNSTQDSQRNDFAHIFARNWRDYFAWLRLGAASAECNILDETQQICPRHGHSHAQQVDHV